MGEAGERATETATHLILCGCSEQHDILGDVDVDPLVIADFARFPYYKLNSLHNSILYHSILLVESFHWKQFQAGFYVPVRVHKLLGLGIFF